MIEFFAGFICGSFLTFLLQFFLCLATNIELDELRKNGSDEHEDINKY